jgi:hypothetical protein
VTIDLTDEERQLLVNLLTIEIEGSKYPLSPRIEQLKRIRAKLRGEAAPPPLVADVSASKRKPRR